MNPKQPSSYDEFDAVYAEDTRFRVSVTRRQTLDMMAAGGLAVTLGPLLDNFISAAHAADDDVVRIGYLPITDALALLVAHGLGYFKYEGLDAPRPTLIRGWSPLVEAFASGKVNVVHFLKPIPVWMRYNNNFPVKVMAWAHTNGSGVVVGQHTDITTFKQFAGKQVAVPFWYSMHNIVLQYGLRQSGVVPVIKPQGALLAANECNLQIMQPPDMPAALAARKIDGYIVAEPFNALGELKAGARMLRFTGDIWRDHPCCVVCIHEEVANKKKEWTQKVVNAIVRAQIYASKNKKEIARLVSKQGEGYLPLPAEVIERAILYYDQDTYGPTQAIKHPEWKSGRIDFQPWPYPSATKLIVNAMNETVVSGDTTFLKKLDPEFVAKDLVNYEYVRNAIEKFPEWKDDPSVNPADPFNREELLSF